jgi:hypothetical protein
MNKCFRKFKTKKASTCLLFLCLICALASFGKETSAKPTTVITIDQGAVDPSIANIGQEVEFSASYSTAAQGSGYALHVCKSKKMSPDAFCRDGSWCVSDTFAIDNPLSCRFTPRADAGGSNKYFMVVCDNQKECSAPYSGTFTVNRSVLSLQTPEYISFKSVPFSFSSQISGNNPLGDLILTSINPENSGWSLDVTATDWQDSKDGDVIDFDGDGSTTGQLTTDLDAISIESSDPTDGIKQGVTASFTADVQTINIATASKKNGNGIFTIKNIKFDQFVPGNQQEGEYKTVLTFTVS